MKPKGHIKPNSLPDYLHERVLDAHITRLEAALLKEIRSLPIGEIRILVVKFDGEPVRIEIESMKQSKNLQAKDGLNLDDATYIDKDIEAEDLKYSAIQNNLKP